MEEQTPFQRLTETVKQLRGEDGCPWDRRQTIESLRPYLLEETYEVLDAIDAEDWPAVREELGDVLLQVILQTQIASEQHLFDIDDVVNGLTAKLVRRHPHVFAGEQVGSVDEVAHRWDEIKMAEKPPGALSSALDGVPAAMPSLLRAFKLQKRAAKTGFDWTDLCDVWAKLEEEIEELRAAVAQRKSRGGARQIEEELGDVLFSIVNVSRFLAVNPELALKRGNDKFTARFHHMEAKSRENGQDLKTLSLKDLDILWNQAKEALANTNKEDL